jgi:hypothetical protein
MTPFRVIFVDLPFKIIQAPRRLVGLSVPARVAIMLAIFLGTCIIIERIAYRINPQMVPWADAFTWGRWLAILALAVAAPIAVYKALQLWLEGDVSKYPDIDFAWKSGLEELQKNGIELTETPVFLVLGSANEAHEKAIADGARLRLRIREVPAGPAALHWYANPEGIYIFCTETSSLSKLANVALKLRDEAPYPQPQMNAPASANIRGTIVPEAQEPSIRMSGPRPGDTESSRGPSNIRGTMVVGGGADVDDATSAGAPDRQIAHVEPQIAAEQARRLEYLCQLLRRAREPLCPINGVVTLLPYELIRIGPGGAREVQKMIASDLGVLSRTLKLRCPVTAVIAGMENESGFRELIRRVGLERAAAQRFGKGFGVWNPPTPEQLEAVCSHACGSFEDWVYSLFKEKGALSKEAGNKKLYSLLCGIRRDFKDRLTNLIAGSYSHESGQKQQSEPLLFGGCYFAATGETEYHQAFLKGAFDKLPEQQEEVEWTREAIGEDQRYLHLAYTAIAFDAVLLLVLGAMIFWHFYKQ